MLYLINNKHTKSSISCTLVTYLMLEYGTYGGHISEALVEASSGFCTHEIMSLGI